MIRFLSFLVENEQTGADIANKGVAFETSTMKAILRKHPLHFRSEDGKTPEQVHQQMETKLGTARMREVEQHAHHAAIAIKQHLGESHPDYEIDNVHWSSNGQNDINAYHKKFNTKRVATGGDNADYVITMKHKRTGLMSHVSVSSKYLDKKGTDFNPGVATLSGMVKNPGSEKKHYEIESTHNKKIVKAIEQHIPNYSKMSSDQKKDAYRQLNKTKPDKIAQLNQLVHNRDKALANHWNKQFSNLDHENMKTAIQSFVGAAPKSFDSHLLVNTNNKTGKTIVSKPDEKVHKILNNIKKIHTEVRGNRIIFHGTDHTGQVHKLAHLEFRSKSLNSSPTVRKIGTSKGSIFND